MVFIRYLLLSVFLALFPAMAFGDDLPPSEEGVCDSLLGGTAGLFGLCNAYCEAQDCDEYAPGDQPQSCQRLLVNYMRKSDGADPPCLIDDDPTCPCWTDQDLADGGLTVPPSSCHFDQDPTDNPAHFDQAFYFDSKNVVGFEADSEECLYFQLIDGTLFMRLSDTSGEENQICRDEIHALHQLDFGGSENCNQFP